VAFEELYGALAADPLVRGIWLGGSRARGEGDDYSDVDLALDAEGWTPAGLGDLWLGGQSFPLGGSPFFHGVLSDGTILDVIVGPVGSGYLLIEAAPISPPPATGPYADGAALDFWLNSMKHAKPFARGVEGMTLFGLHHDSMALFRLWVLQDTGRDPGPSAFSIFGLTPLVRDHLTGERLRLLGMPKGNPDELRDAVQALRDAASEAGRAAEEKWGVSYPDRLESVVRERWRV
jgi:hypothetical protein